MQLTSLTSKSDFQKFKAINTDPLNMEQTSQAMNDLINTDFVDKYPRRETRFADPNIPLQRYGLVSFVPSSGAKPDEDGIYGMMKLRGNYDTEQECVERAQFIIQNVDSYHVIHHAHVGRSFPITNSDKFSEVIDKVDVQKKDVQIQSQSIKEQKQEDKREIQEMKEQEERLLEESKREEQDPLDYYTTLRTKKAQLSWTYLEHTNKLKEIEKILVKTQKEIMSMDNESDTYGKQFYDTYMQARERSGLPKDDTSFMKYLVEDAELPFLEGLSLEEEKEK